jgi:ABC-type dipeptide/oligopeptide/nickel transport system permease subunit
MAECAVQQRPGRKPAAFQKREANPYLLAWRRLLHKPAGCVCLYVVVGFVLLALVGPHLAGQDAFVMNASAELHGPSRQHPLGTDQFGRDILSRVMYGIRISFVVALSAAFLGAAVGISTGIFAGYSGAWIEAVIMRIYDALFAFPTILLAIGIAATTGPGIFNAALALAIVSVPQFARIVRGGTLVEKNKDYVNAAICLGGSNGRIMLQHILPNVTSPSLVQFTLFMAFAVLVESALSFLGLGVPPPYPSLGSMLAEGRQFIQKAPWYCAAPGIVLTLMIFALNTLSDAVRDVLDPRLLR